MYIVGIEIFYLTWALKYFMYGSTLNLFFCYLYILKYTLILLNVAY